MLTELLRHGLTFGVADAPLRPRRHVDLRVPRWCAGSRPVQPRYISIGAQANGRGPGMPDGHPGRTGWQVTDLCRGAGERAAVGEHRAGEVPVLGWLDFARR